MLRFGASRRRINLHPANGVFLHYFLLRLLVSHRLAAFNSTPTNTHILSATLIDDRTISSASRRKRKFPRRENTRSLRAPRCYNPGMTLVEVTYELQGPLRPEQLRALGQFANTYGLRRFQINEQLNQLSFEYDASRLKETEVAHVLRMARIPVQRRV